jgi:Tfp pilus assembly protein PilX
MRRPPEIPLPLARPDDTGSARVIVLGAMMVLTLFVVVASARVDTSLTAARKDRARTQALALADGAVNDMTWRLSQAAQPTDVVLPSDYATWTPDCERAWIRWVLTAPTGTAAGSCGTSVWTPPLPAPAWQAADAGSWTVVYPALPTGAPAKVVYGAGRVTNGTQTTMRVVRLDITTSSAVKVDVAVSTNSEVQVSGSGAVYGPAGSLHTNGTLTVCCSTMEFSGNITYGSCTPSSTCADAADNSCTGTGVSAGCRPADSTAVPPGALPVLSPRSYYRFASYVWCPGPANAGEVRLGPAYTGPLGTPADPGATPCTSGSIVAPLPGWSYSSSHRLWTWNNSVSAPSAVHYGYGTDIRIQSSAVSYGTAITEGIPTGTATPCALLGGSVSYQGSGCLQPDTSTSPIGILSDGPLDIGASGGAYDGIAYTNQYFNVTGAGGGGNFALVSNDQHTPACGANILRGSAKWGYDGTITLTAGSSAQVGVSSWLER